MDFTLDPADQAFQEEVRTFIRTHLPADIARRGRQGYHPRRDDVQRWTRILNEKGWAAPAWPAEYGGTGWSPLRRYLFQVEFHAAGCPVLDQSGFELVGPVLYSFASAAQKARYLPAIRNADEFWCQGFSEPNAGSDLASLKTRAVRDGDHYIVNGQKTWTSEAHKADMMFALVRTDPQAPPQAGISFLLIDMKSPGITVRPIYTINEGHSVNEIFLDDVRVPAENLVGEENKGWSYAKFLLNNERAMSAETAHTQHDLDLLKEIAAGERTPLFAAKMARLEIELMALEYAVLRVLHTDAGDPALNSVASVLKIRGAELRQRVADLAVEALGDHGLAVYPDIEGQDNMDVLAPVPPAPDHAAGVLSKSMFRRATTIYGGTNEIQRTIIAKSVLGSKGMDFSLTQEQQALQDSVRRFCEREYGFEQRRKLLTGEDGFARANWTTFAELGWLGAGLSEEAGGYGGGPVETMIILEQMARALVLEPFLSCAVLAAQAILAQATPEQRDALLPAIIAGETLAALANGPQTAAIRMSDGYVLNGRANFVLGGPSADLLLVSARNGAGVSLFRIDPASPGSTRHDYHAVDGRRVSDIVLESVRVGADALLGKEGTAAPAIALAEDHAAIGLCAEAVGAMDAALWLTRDYLKTRRQFGQTLNSFQALQHRMADMLIETELARSMLYRGVAALSETNPAARRKGVSAAKVQIGEAGYFVGGQAIQLHGAIGVTEEYSVGHYFKRLTLVRGLFGTTDTHLARFACAMKTLAQLVMRNARLFPDDRFLVEGDRTQTNRQHLERAKKLASALHHAGCRRQDRVAILAMNCSEYVETFSAAWLAGFILSTVNFRLAPPEIRFVLTDTAPRVLIFEAQYADTVAGLRAELGIETYVAIGDAPPWAESYEAFLAHGSADGPPISARPGDIAHIIYTSGTTGRPKGVMRSHACEFALAETMSAVMDMRPRGRLLEVMPFFHAGAQSSILGQLWRGGEVHIHRKFDAADLLRAVQDQRISHLHLVPLMVEALVETPEFDSFDLSSIETILYAAAPMPAPVLRRALAKLGPVFVNSWGMTEGSGTALPKHMHEPDGPGAALLGSIGQPYTNAEIRIVDDHGHDCAVGAPGELWLRSAAMASGYWNNSAATIESFRDGWLRTGDIGYADAAGRIFLVDRRKDMIISGGENIYSQEVERAIAEHPAVAGVAVIGVPDAKWGEAVMAIVIARPGETVMAEDIVRHCASRIASYKKPRHVTFVTEFPTLPSGKVNKMRLRELYRG